MCFLFLVEQSKRTADIEQDAPGFSHTVFCCKKAKMGDLGINLTFLFGGGGIKWALTQSDYRWR